MIWNVNATGAGGGVAESLRALLGYLLDAGIQARSLVLDGNDEFFAATKCLHNAIHGFGDDGQLGPAGHAEYQRTIAANANDLSRSAWEFLRPYVQDADALVFSWPQYAPDWVPPGRLQVLPPSIDPLAAKNQPLSAAQCRRILLDAGLRAPDSDTPRAAVCAGAPPGPDARVIVQVSRWDRLKDMPGVMTGFDPADLPLDVHLMLVGPSAVGVADDPEGADVLAESTAHWDRFGLTVAEAMWKRKPVVASAVGGIQDQITDGEDALLTTGT